MPLLTLLWSLFALVAPIPFAPTAVRVDEPVDQRANYDEQLLREQAKLVEELEDLARWCFGQKLFGAADTAYRQILELDPEHAQARKSLKFRRRRGVWVQSASYRKPRNLAKEPLVELEARRDAVLGGYKRFVFELNERSAGEVPVEKRARVLAQLVRMLPDDPEVRAANGEAWYKGEWGLLESSETLRRRRWVEELARTCVSTAPSGDPDAPNALELNLGLDWSLVLSTPYVRVAGTGDPEEVRTVLRMTHAAGEFYRSLLSNDSMPPVGFAIYLLANTGEKRQFLDNHPRVSPRDRPFLESLESAGIPQTGQTVEWSETAVQRLDRSVRQTIGMMMTDSYGITTDDGWAWEGIGIYLTYQLLGTRLTYFIRPNRYSGDPNAAESQKRLFKRMYAPDAAWMDEARLYFLERRPPRLGFLMGRKVDSMSAQDLLWSYVVAAYLIEGRAEQTPEFLTLVGGGMRPQEACVKVFDVDIHQLEARIIRWLEETR